MYIREVNRQDAGDYTCNAENPIAKDSITHKLQILAPPQAPQVVVASTSTDSITVKLKKSDTETAPIHGYTLHYKPEFVSDGEIIQFCHLADFFRVYSG